MYICLLLFIHLLYMFAIVWSLQLLFLIHWFRFRFKMVAPVYRRAKFGLSKNRSFCGSPANLFGAPKSSILMGVSAINHPFGGTPISGNLHFWTVKGANPCKLTVDLSLTVLSLHTVLDIVPQDLLQWISWILSTRCPAPTTWVGNPQSQFC